MGVRGSCPATVALPALLLFPALASAQAPGAAKLDPAGVQFFEQKVRPVLVQHCYECHSAKSKRPRGGLRVDTRAGLLKGGDSGPALVPGKPLSSLLIKALRHDEVAMPPKGKLPDAVVQDFVRWVKMGAPDPRDGSAAPARTGIDVEAGRKFWAFQPPRRYPAPAVRDASWPRSDVDRFVLAALEASGLRPARDADRPTLLRRVSLDLTGLPPTPEEIDAFVADGAADAFARVVDRLLASPAFGERWGRHWLDVARYADSNGKDENLTFHEAWRYRDYVLASFNADKPYDQFVREQLAGDLLPAADQAQRDEQLTGTGFLVVGPKVLANRDQPQRKMDVIDEQIDTVGRTFLGLALGCARCHDHKFDPIPTTDYYALAGIFASTRTLDGFKLGNPVVSGWMLRPLGPDGEKAHASQLAHQKKLKGVADALRKARADLKAHEERAARRPAGAPEKDVEKATGAARARVKELEAEERRLKAAAPPAPRLVMAVRDEDAPADVRVNVRGNPYALGELVPRGFLTVASAGPRPKLPAGQSGRRELAAWVASKDNPLTARVFVNRAWLHLFGEGLVRTVDDFGARGTRPTRPELLDALAVRFVEEGWSLKRLVRHLVLSRTYQLSVVGDPAGARVDPENRLLGRANRRRLEAEVIRDAILAVSGQMERGVGGSAVLGLGEQAINNSSKGGAPTDRNTRRSVYLPVIRNDLPPIFEVFDFADPDVATGKRDATTVPTQALYLMNSPFVLSQARQAARRLLATPADDAVRLTLLYRRALGRAPAARERESALRFLREQRRDRAAGPGAEAELEAWADVCQAVFGCTEFRFVE
jgi:hypothetical protein